MGGEPAPPPVDERERQAAHAACVAWLKQPGGKSATPYGHFLRGWYAHQEWLEKASAERIAELERCLRTATRQSHAWRAVKQHRRRVAPPFPVLELWCDQEYQVGPFWLHHPCELVAAFLERAAAPGRVGTERR